MKRRTTIPAAIMFTAAVTATAALEPRIDAPVTSDQASRTAVTEAFNRLPLSFDEYTDARGRTQFTSRNPGYTVALAAAGAVLALPGQSTLRMRVVGGNRSAQADPLEELGGKSHYLLGSDRTKWRTNVRRFARVRFRDVYPGVDLVYYGRGQKLEYDFTVSPGSDPARIGLRFDGAGGMALDERGGLVLHLRAGDVRMDPPSLYQDTPAGRRPVAGRYLVDGSQQVGFDVGAYDHARPLVIDPTIAYSTYFGGRGEDAATAIAVDADGFAYITGTTESVDRDDLVGDLPTADALQPALGGAWDAFVTKFTADGSAVVFSTYLGGQSGDEGHGIAVDRLGHIYVTGQTFSRNFPMVNPLQPACGVSDDVFVAKLDPTGAALEYSTCLGGSDRDVAMGIAVDRAGNAYVVGDTYSADFPTRNAVQPVSGGLQDAFVSVIRSDGAALVYSTFLGGSANDEGRGIAVDDRRNVYVTGKTGSADFPVLNAFQPALRGSSDAFVVKIDRAGSELAYSTYLGGAVGLGFGPDISRGGDEAGLAIAADASGNAYVTGRTNSTDFPTLNAMQRKLGGPQHPTRFLYTTDAFVTELDQRGAPVYSTYLGGNDDDEGAGIAVDDRGVAWVTGLTASANFPSRRALQPAFGDALVFASSNGGANWNAAGGVGHRVVLSLALDPVDPSIVYAGTFGGGVFKSTNGGHAWTAINSGLTNLFVTSVAIDRTNTATLYAGTDGAGVFKSTDGGQTWSLHRQGMSIREVAAVAIDPTNSSILYAATGIRGGGSVYRSADGGETWHFGGGLGIINALAIDPVTPSTIYAGARSGVWKSTDRGVNWSLSVTGLGFTNVTAVVIDPGDHTTLYAASDDQAQGIFKSTDSAATWSRRTNGLNNFTVRTLAVHASSPLTLYAGTQGGIYKTTNGGDSWSASSAGLTSSPVNTLAIDPIDPAIVYAGAEGTTDVFVAAIRRNGSLRYASFLGGNSTETAGGIAIGPRRRIYVAGATTSPDFPTVMPVQPASAGRSEAFVTVMSPRRAR